MLVLLVGVLVASCASPDVRPRADDLDVAASGNEALPWAFVVNDPASEGSAALDPGEIVTVPGSPLSLPRSEIAIANGPPDWHPDGHPPMPEIVAHGGGDGVLACGYCHLPNGQGKPENAGLAGQPLEYLLQQMADYRDGLRVTGESRMVPPSLMMSIGAAATPEDARVALEYFASMDFRPWIRVVETDSVPATRFAGSIHEVIAGAGMEPIGLRVVEIPEDLTRTKLRDDASGFVAYVPLGAISRGEALVRDGREGGVPCTTCHGEDLRGLGPMPALAGRSPSYLARQLYDLRQGTRRGAWSGLMTEAVAGLTRQEIVDIVSYLASLEP
jgi:cytochrome c553